MQASPARRPDVAWVAVDGDIVAMEPDGDLHVLRGAAAAMWQLIDGGPLDGLEVAIAETFGITVEQAAADMAEALELLDDTGIIDITPAR